MPVAKRIVVHRIFTLDPIVSCDETHISEMVLNLLKNAAEAMNAKSGIIQIQIDMDRKGIHLQVADNGPGIPKQELSRVFEPFYSTKKRNANFGLGLTYCYMVAQAHGGTLNVNSEFGKGTVFILRLPKKRILSDGEHMNQSVERGVGQIEIS